MNQLPLTLENLKSLDFGKISAAFSAELKHVVKDCQDRPLDGNPRTVTIRFTLKPEADTQGSQPDCESIKVEGEITSTVPKRRTKIYNMKPKQDGSLGFNPDLPEEPEGSTLYDDDQK